MSLRCVVGNLLDEASAVTMTPAADPLFPAEFLHDGPGQLGARFGSVAADSEVRISFASDIPFGDGFETGAATGDVIASSDGTLVEDIETDWEIEHHGSVVAFLQLVHDSLLGFLPNDHGGNEFSLSIATSDDAGATASIAVTARAGRTYFVNAWAVNGSSTLSAVRLFNPATGLYLKADGAWAAGAQNLVADTSGDFVWLGVNVGAGVTFTMPDVDELGAHEVALQFQLHSLAGGGGGVSFFDDLVFQALPLLDFVFIGGNHNIQAAAGPVLLQSSDDGSSWTTRATLTVARHQFWHRLAAPVTAAYWRILFDGTPTLKMWMGDVVLGLVQELDREPQDQIGIEYVETGQIRQESPGGSTRISNRGPYPQRRLNARLRFPSAAEEAAFRAIFVDRVRGGETPIVVIPAVDLEPLALYGDPEGPLSFTYAMLAGQQSGDPTRSEFYSDVSLSIREGAGFEI